MKNVMPQKPVTKDRLFKQLSRLSEQDLKSLHIYIDDLIWRKRFSVFARSVIAMKKKIIISTNKK